MAGRTAAAQKASAATGANAAQATEEEAKRRAAEAGQDWTDLTPEQRKQKIEEIHREKANYAGVYDYNFADNPGQKAWIAKLFAKLNDEQRQRVLNDWWYNQFLADKGVGRMLLTNLFANPDQLGGILLGLLFKKIIQWGSAYRLNKLAAMIDAEVAGIEAGKGKDEKFDAATKAKDPNQSLSLGEIDKEQRAEIETKRDTFWKEVRDEAVNLGANAEAVGRIDTPEKTKWIEEQRVKAYKALDSKITDADPIGKTLLTRKTLTTADRVKGFFDTFKKSLNSSDCPFEADEKLTAARMVIGDLGTTDDAKLLLDDIEEERKEAIGKTLAETEAPPEFKAAEIRQELLEAANRDNENDRRAGKPTFTEAGINQKVNDQLEKLRKQSEKAHADYKTYHDILVKGPTDAVQNAHRTAQGLAEVKEQLRLVKAYAIGQDDRHDFMKKLCTDYAEKDTTTQQMLEAYTALEAATEIDNDPNSPPLLLNKKFIADQKSKALITKMKTAAPAIQISFDEDKIKTFGTNPNDYLAYVGTDGPATAAQKAKLDTYFKGAKTQLDGFVTAGFLTPMEARKAYYQLAADHNKLHQQRFEAATKAQPSDDVSTEALRRKLISPQELIVSAGITTQEFLKLKADFDPLQNSLDGVKEKITGFEKAEEELMVYDKKKYPNTKDWTAAKTKLAEDKKAELAKQKDLQEKIDKLFCPEDEKALRSLAREFPEENNATRQDIEAILKQRFSKPAAGPTSVPVQGNPAFGSEQDRVAALKKEAQRQQEATNASTP